MGWERVILPQLVELIDRFPNYGSPISTKQGMTFGKDRKDVKDLSPNHWELGISSELLRSAAYGSQSEWIAARDVHVYALDLHLTKIGLWTSEQYTGAPHGGFYLDALVAARMAVFIARKNDSRFDLDEMNMLLAGNLNEYTRRLLSYLHACATPTGEIVCCGERMPKGPDAPQQSAFYRELCNLQHPNARKIKNQLGDDFWLSLRGLRSLLSQDSSIKTIMDVVRSSPISLPFTAQKVTLEKWSTGHLARYANPTGGDSTCRWVWVDKEKVKWGVNTSECPPPVKPVEMHIESLKHKEISTVKEDEFSLSQLWPKSNHNWMAPGAITGTSSQYGAGLDLGALRLRNSQWEILVSKTPTKADPANSEWVIFNSANEQMLMAANSFNRYGPGWSYGPGHNLHDEVVGYFIELYEREPSPMEQKDIEHDQRLWKKLLADHATKFPVEPVKPTPVDPKPVDPKPTELKPIDPKPVPVEPAPGKPSEPTSNLSTIEKRLTELLPLIPVWARIAIGDSLLIPVIREAVQAKRRAEDRIVQRVIEGLKK